MTNWKDIHPDFTPELQKQWQANKLTYEVAQEWINIGLKPTDCPFVVYLRDVVSCDAEEVLNFWDLGTLKSQYQEYLQSQGEEDESIQLARAMFLSLGIFNFDDNLELKKSNLSDRQLEPYLQTKRLDLKKYFVFSLGKEINIEPKITVSDKSGKIVSEPLPNVRQAKPLLTKHLTQLFNDGHEKVAIAFAGKNTEQLSLPWTGDQLDRKIENGDECYIVFDKSKVEDNPSYINKRTSSNTQLGKLYWNKIIVLAVEAQPQVKIFQSKKNVLKFLRENDFKCRAVSCKEEIIGQRDYCLYHQTCLARLEEKKSIPNIQVIDTFATWFNGNCGYVINKNDTASAVYPYYLWIVVFEPEDKEFTENWAIIDYEYHYKYLVGAERKAKGLKEKLQKDDWQVNPILLLHPKADKYTTFADLVCEPYVRKVEVPHETEETEHTWDDFCGDDTLAKASLLEKDVNIFEKIKIPIANKTPSDYLKPLDAVWVEKIAFPGVLYCHVGIYLGDNWICHFSSKSGKREDNKTIITDWETFIKGRFVGGKVFAYHPVLPFKHYELIAQQIDWAWANEYDKGWYCLPNNNCEHHANSFVFGIDYSQQVKERGPAYWPRRCELCDSCRREIINNGKGSTVKLTNEVKETNDELGNNTGHWYDRIKTEYEAKTVVPPKDCRLM